MGDLVGRRRTKVSTHRGKNPKPGSVAKGGEVVLTGLVPLLDVPAEKPSKDFDHYADVLAKMLLKAEPARLTVGVFGGYGSGKTTLLNAIRKKLDDASKSEDPVITVFFEAWRYDYEPHLFLPFISAIVRNEGLKTKKSVKTKLAGGVRSFLYSLSLNLGVVTMSAKDALNQGRRLEKESITNLERMAGGYDDIASSLRDLVQGVPKDKASRRIVVLIDDLDRCFPGKALGLLEAMKSFMDIPGYLFVIALDPRVIAQYLAGKYGRNFDISADEYLEKMVQVPFHLPRPDLQAVMDLINAVLSEVVARAGSAVWAGAVQESLERLAEYLPRNIRQAKRILNMHQSISAARPKLKSNLLLALLIVQARWRLAYWALQRYRVAFHGYFNACENPVPGPDVPEALAKHKEALAELRDNEMRRFYIEHVYGPAGKNVEALLPYLDMMGWPVDTEARVRTGSMR